MRGSFINNRTLFNFDMGKIREIKGYEKIAAGEVVERPASVIKELVENSLDAESTQIKIIMKNYGKELIQIIDNGTGIEKEDILLAFKSHASSKVHDADEMIEKGVTTFGFRGEALASISAVSNIELITRTADSPTAYKVTFSNGVFSPIEQTGGPKGTNIKVMNLFYNTPVRLKFLKSNAVELAHVTNILTRFALAHPDVHFQFFHNDAVLINTPKSKSVLDRILTLYGKMVADAMIPVAYEDSLFKIRGFIGLPETARSNRSVASVFVNRRWVVSSIITDLIEHAYEDYIMKNQFPFYVLFIELDPAKVDFNIHPTKKMVRFAYEDILIENLGKIIDGIVADKFKNSRIYGVKTDDMKEIIRESKNTANSTQEAISDDEEETQFLETDKKFHASQNASLQRRINETPSNDLSNTTQPNDLSITTQPNDLSNTTQPNDLRNTTQPNDLRNTTQLNDLRNTLISNKNDQMQRFIQSTFKTETEIKPELRMPASKIDNRAGISDGAGKNYQDSRNSTQGKSKSFVQEVIQSFKQNRTQKDMEIQELEINNEKEPEQAEDFQAQTKNPTILQTNERLNLKKLPQVRFPNESFQFHDNYIILQTEKGIIIFDQHAVHERINYEKTIKMFKERKVRKQKLIIPIPFSSNPEDIEFVSAAMDKLEQFGFELKQENNQLFLTAIPSMISEINQQEIVDAAKTIIEYGKTSFEQLEDEIIHYIACKSSIKAGDTINDRDAIKRLLIELDNCANPFHCAHGRPTMVELSLTEIEKMFKRIL